MKTIIFGFILVSIIANFQSSLKEEDKTDSIADTYVCNCPEWSTEEYLDYYLKNNFAIGSTPSAYNKMIFDGKLNQHLNNTYPSYTWILSTSNAKTVSNIKGGNPLNIKENDSDIAKAKESSRIKDQQYIGCGPLAMVSQLDFLARYGGYTQFFSNPSYSTQRISFIKDVFDVLDTEPTDGDFFSSLSLISNSTFSSGTFTFPMSFIEAANKMFLDYNITTGIGPEEVFEDGEYKKLITIRGDSIPSLASFEAKKSAIISSIDKGMPVVWWTLPSNDLGDFDGHYMNIFGYEKWTGTDSSGNTVEHLYFKLNMNWYGNSNYDNGVYMDSNILDSSFNCGFIFFEEELPKINIKKEDYGLGESYIKSMNKNIQKNGYTINVTTLRTGLIHEDGFTSSKDSHITMSSKKQGAGEAYICYKSLNQAINFIFFDIRLWSSSEQLTKYNGDILLQFKDKNGFWKTAVDFFNSEDRPNGLTSNKTNPDRFRYDFPYDVNEFRFVAHSYNPTGSVNKGRVVIDNLGIVFATFGNSRAPCLDVSLFSNQNGSSSLTDSGHSFIALYNNSIQTLDIGLYRLKPYEGMTLGLWGNREHKGVYFNLEYFQLLETELDYLVASSCIGSYVSGVSSNGSGASSNSSATSSSSSSGSQEGLTNTGRFFTGLGGLSTWLSKKFSQKIIIKKYTGAVSITESVSISKASSIDEIVRANNDRYSLFYNCSDFAIDIWNSIGSSISFEKDFIQTPKDLKEQIKNFNGYQTNRNMFGDPMNVGYYKDGIFVVDKQ